MTRRRKGRSVAGCNGIAMRFGDGGDLAVRDAYLMSLGRA
jgi:hypothetical protein